MAYCRFSFFSVCFSVCIHLFVWSSFLFKSVCFLISFPICQVLLWKSRYNSIIQGRVLPLFVNVLLIVMTPSPSIKNCRGNVGLNPLSFVTAFILITCQKVKYRGQYVFYRTISETCCAKNNIYIQYSTYVYQSSDWYLLYIYIVYRKI